MTHVKHFAIALPTRSLASGKKRVSYALLVLFAFLVPGLPQAVAQTFPALTGRVVDAAGLLDAGERARLEDKLASFETKSSDQVVVATVQDLQGYAIEEFAVGLGRAWKIGQKGENNGVLLLVSKGDRKVRIEVGYGLEGTLTDALTQVIIQTDVLPAFKAGDYAKGIEKGVDGIIAVLSGDAAELQARAERNTSSQEDGDIVGAIFVLIFFLFWILMFVRSFFCGLARRFGTRQARGRWRWLGITWCPDPSSPTRRKGWTSGWTTTGSSWSSSSSSSGGGFSGGGGSFGGGGSSGSW